MLFQRPRLGHAIDQLDAPRRISRLAVRCDGLTFRPAGADGPTPIRNLSFRLDANQTLLVSGPSGCGKSMLLGLLAGHAPYHAEPAYAGTLAIDDQGPHTEHDLELPKRRPDVAMLHQEPGDGLLHLDVLTNLQRAAERNRHRTTENITDRILATTQRFGITELAGRETATLSHGERKRVALACLELQDPDLLLLDEPLAGLDPQATRLLLDDLQHLTRYRTVIIAEHRAAPLAHLADKQLHLGITGPSIGNPADPLEPPGTAIGQRPRTNASTQPLIQLDGVDLAREGRILARGLDLALGPGVWGLVGPNGAGKSTLLATIAGLEAPARGTVAVADESVWPLPPGRFHRARKRRAPGDETRLRAKLQIAFQEPREAFLASSVLVELRRPLERVRGHDVAEAEHRVLQGLQDHGLEHLAERPPLRLSGGESRKVQVLDNLLVQPRVWLLDEPTHGLDPAARRELAARIVAFARGGGCVVVATHEPGALEHVDGWIAFDGQGAVHTAADDHLLTMLGYDVTADAAQAKVRQEVSA